MGSGTESQGDHFSKVFFLVIFLSCCPYYKGEKSKPPQNKFCNRCRLTLSSTPLFIEGNTHLLWACFCSSLHSLWSPYWVEWDVHLKILAGHNHGYLQTSVIMYPKK